MVVISSFIRRKRLVYIFSILSIFAILEILGIFIHPFELDFNKSFAYPVSLPNFQEFVQFYERGLNPDGLEAINDYPYKFLVKNPEKCRKYREKLDKNSSSTTSFLDDFQDVFLLIMVKSSIGNKFRRDQIRKSWGFEKRFADVSIKTVFILGTCEDLIVEGNDQINAQHHKFCQDSVDDESKIYHDIVQADFVDTELNATIKSVLALKWVIEECSRTHFLLMVNDDYYVSVKNLLKFIRNPFDDQVKDLTKPFKEPKKGNFDGRLYGGFVMPSAHPVRQKFNKLYVSLSEYEYSRYPSYVAGGSIVFSKPAMLDMYYASLFTKHFKLDDVYLGIIAKKMGITPFHSPYFHPLTRPASDLEYSMTIASHGFDDPIEMNEIWENQKSLGYA